jgi:hypothetical protein
VDQGLLEILLVSSSRTFYTYGTQRFIAMLKNVTYPETDNPICLFTTISVKSTLLCSIIYAYPPEDSCLLLMLYDKHSDLSHGATFHIHPTLLCFINIDIRCNFNTRKQSLCKRISFGANIFLLTSFTNTSSPDASLTMTKNKFLTHTIHQSNYSSVNLHFYAFKQDTWRYSF